jgi:16S rRNA (cytidine1402-2'-O)-methyltransferase
VAPKNKGALHSKGAFGSLYVVATPIGNLADITQRAISTLQSVDAILAEDTRHSKLLLRSLDIEKPLFAVHAHNEAQCAASWIERLKQGESFALISDAGTPLISDPGHVLVKAAHQTGIPVVPIPGACALIAALCASGLPAQRFSFEGFLSAKKGERKASLTALSEETRTLIFYEAPHRILASLQDMRAAFGDQRPATLGRELTKQFETIKLGTLADIHAFCTLDINQQKGEMVVLVAGKSREEIAAAALSPSTIKTLELLLEALPTNQAIRLAAQITGEKKNRLYEFYLQHHAS